MARESGVTALDAASIDPASAQWIAWCAVGVVNQALITVLAEHPVGALPRVLHHAYDAGNFIALGALSFAAVRGVRWLVSSRRIAAASSIWFAPLLLALVVFGVSMATIEQDVANIAETNALPTWQVSLAAALVFGIALGATAFLRRLRAVPFRVALALGGVSLAIVNALVLEGDYYTTHLMLAWLGALLIGYSVEGLAPRLLPGTMRVAGAAILAVCGALSLLTTPSSAVLRALYSLSSSVVPPVVAWILPDNHEVDLELVAPIYAGSPWFQQRRSGAPVPPSRAVSVAEPNIVLFFTVDALRADVLEQPKYLKQLPNLARLREESSYFSQARSPTPSTKTSISSLFANRYFSQMRWGRNEKGQTQLLEGGARLPEILGEAGVGTVIVATPRGGILSNGITRGFAETQKLNQKSRTPTALTVDFMIKKLKKGPKGPLFMYSHLMEPHGPYDLAGKQGTQFERYLREVALVDREIGRLREFLDEADLAKNTSIIFSADHGEGFGEHGQFGHARSVYEEAIHVPLIVHVPGAPAQKIDTLVSVMDVAPTVLDLFGLPTPSAYMGESLLPVAAGKPPTFTRPVVADAGRRIQAFYFNDGTKVIFDIGQHTTEVYDLKADPGERDNLVDNDSSDVRAKVATARLFFDRIELREPGYQAPWQKF